MSDIHRLCYIDGHKAYFTTKPVNAQWGDDWDDAPYEHNAGDPYEEAGINIRAVYYESALITPEEMANGNSQWSVQQINKGQVAWLRNSCNADEFMMAGITLENFIKNITAWGGTVYLPTRES